MCNEADIRGYKNEITRKWKRSREREKAGGQDEYGILNVGKKDKRMRAGKKKRGGGKEGASKRKEVY